MFSSEVDVVAVISPHLILFNAKAVEQAISNLLIAAVSSSTAII